MDDDEGEEGRVDDGKRKANAAMGSRQRTTRARRRVMAGAGGLCLCVCVRRRRGELPHGWWGWFVSVFVLGEETW